MPHLSTISTEAPLFGSSPQHSDFVFPHGRHLLVTTARHIFAWDDSGIHAVFRSSRSSIVAAKEATDGSGILAVASRNVVVLHDTKRGKERSWGLNAPEDEVRHLEYSHDAKSLYLSTTSDGHIQQYSLERSRLLEPLQKHASAPVALAVSPTGHLMLSASSSPPAVYLKNLAHNTAACLVQPAASCSPVCAAAFHPERPDLFLLAFRDATVAVYDATRISKAGRYGNQVATNDGEICRLTGVHRSTVAGDSSLDIASTAPPIAGVAFLPSHKLRAVTAGRDGRCRIIDFAKGGAVLRTWHCRAPCTTVSVLTAGPSTPPNSDCTAPDANWQQGAGVLPHTGLIAVGLFDGRVQVYDSVGLLLIERQFNSQEEKIVSVEWCNGPPPCAASSDTTRAPDRQDLHGLEQSVAQKTAARSSNAQPKPKVKCENGLGLPASLKTTSTQAPQALRQLTIHPDEVCASTVRRSSVSRQSGVSTLPSHRYEDLFSPVKSTAARIASQRHVSSPHRKRPRLSSQTFVRSPGAEAKLNNMKLALSASSSSTSSGISSASKRPSEGLKVSPKPALQASSQVLSRNSKGRAISFKPSAMNIGDATVGGSQRTTSLHINTVASKHLAKVIAARNRTAKKDLPSASEQEETNEFDEDADIWLTSEDEGSLSRRPRRHRTKRNDFDPHKPHDPRSLPANTRRPDVASAEEEFITARSAFSPLKGLTSVSEDVRELFPRSSSLSPPKVNEAMQNKAKSKGHSHTSQQARSQTTVPLTAIGVNAANGRQSKSPWARARASKEPKVKSVRKNEFVTVLHNGDGSVDNVPIAGLTRSPSFTCLTCPQTKARVQDLEGEVAQLKGEVLALKAVLRRNGLEVKGFMR